MKALISFTLVLFWTSLAWAHDLWLLPPGSASSQRIIQIRTTHGMDFPRGDEPPGPDRFQKSWVLAPDQTSLPMTVKVPQGEAGILQFVPKTRGLYIAAVDAKVRTIELDAKSFNHYLVADGMPHVYEARYREGALDRPAKERYQKYVKTLIRVGPGPVLGWDRQTGQRLEIVPLEDPFSLEVGHTLLFQVLFEGKPLVDASIGWDHPNDGNLPAGTVRTNLAGEARIPILKTGLMALRLTHMQQPKNPDYEWDSAWTTLTFIVPEPKEARLGVGAAMRKVRAIHGGVGPFAMAGYRMGQDAAQRLGVKDPAFRLEIKHHTPQEVQYACVADGLQAATQVSAGKLNLSQTLAKKRAVRTEVKDKKTQRTLVYELVPSFYKRYLNQPRPKLPQLAREVAGLPPDQIFRVKEGQSVR